MVEGAPLEASFFARPVCEVAPDLVGCTLLVADVGGVIVEVERYDQDDPASHSFRGPTPRAAVMFGPPGRLYVYRSYGVHWCLNLVCEAEGRGAAVLVRALEPVVGIGAMRTRRGRTDARDLCSGPGKVCQALGVDGALNGSAVTPAGPVRVLGRTQPVAVEAGPRIGITRAVERPWRYMAAGSRYLSRPAARMAA